MIKIFPRKFSKIFQQKRIVLACLFGSEARGEAHKESDIDIGVLFDRKIDPEKYLRAEGELIAFFSGIYPGKEINIVNLNIGSPLLKQNAVLDGKLLYRKDRFTEIQFQYNTLHEYEEYLHLSDIYEKFLELKLKAL